MTNYPPKLKNYLKNYRFLLKFHKRFYKIESKDFIIWQMMP